MNCWECGHTKERHFGTHITFGVNSCFSTDDNEDRPAKIKSPGGCMWTEVWGKWDKNDRESNWCNCRKFVDNLSFIEALAKEKELI